MTFLIAGNGSDILFLQIQGLNRFLTSDTDNLNFPYVNREKRHMAPQCFHVLLVARCVHPSKFVLHNNSQDGTPTLNTIFYYAAHPDTK